MILKNMRKITDWEKIFAKHTSDQGLLSKIHKALLKFNKKTNNLIKNVMKILTDYSPKKILLGVMNTGMPSYEQADLQFTLEEVGP